MRTLPERLGKYPILRVLGEGAMGVVYEGFDPVIRRPLAIKTIRRELIEGGSGGQAMVARFRNEAQAAGRLTHPGIAGVYEYGEDERCAYIAMEFVPGGSVREFLSRRPRFAHEDVLSVMVQLLDALEHAHAHGVAHRDIKPANLMITRDGRLKVTDFGVARIEAAGLTLDGAVIGTPGFIAPEQYTEDTIDGRVDLYAAGVLMYQLLAGRTPFGGSPEAVMYKTLHEQPAPPSSIEGAADAARFDAVVMRALAKSPAERHPSAAAFREALVALAAQPIHATVSEETLVMAPMRAASPSPGLSTGGLSGGLSGGVRGAVSGAAPAGVAGDASVAPGTAPTRLSTWDPEVLAGVEARLSRHLGPVARVLVRRAAAATEDVAALVDRLAADLPDDADRTSFRTATMAQFGGAATTAIGGTGTGVASAVAPPGPPATGAGTVASGTAAATAGDGPLTPAYLEQSTRVIAARVGPIAKLLVRRAAADACGRRAFAQALVASADLGDAAGPALAELLRLPG